MDVVPLRDLALLGFSLSRAHLLHLLPARPGARVTRKKMKNLFLYLKLAKKEKELKPYQRLLYLILC